MPDILNIAFAGLLATVLLTRYDVPVVCGGVLASGAGEKVSVRILAPIILLGAIVLASFFPVSGGEELHAGAILPIGIATFITAFITSRLSRFPAVPYAFAGAVAGCARAMGSTAVWNAAAPMLISWICAPLLCGVLAAGIYKLHVIISAKHSAHVIKEEYNLLKVSSAASLLLLAAFAWNNSRLFTLMPASCYSPGITAAFAVGIALLTVLLNTGRLPKATWSVADTDLDVNSHSTLSVVLSMALTFLVFAATPLSAGTLFIAALTGISLVRGRALVDGDEIGRSVFAAVLAPIIGALAGYSLCRILDGDPVSTLIVSGLALSVAGVAFYLRWKESQSLRKQILRSREEQINSAQKSLSALEVKAEMTEKDLLGKLDIKRQELVDFAVGVSDQKKYMENIYEDLKEVRSMPDGADKNIRIDQMLSSLRERMYFTREMNDFYARSEVLHKDFNMRLSEAYPKLTENERKLANLLRQGFSSKYIASLMNITPKSVEINRYRLRAKLGLKRTDNLTQFIKSI